MEKLWIRVTCVQTARVVSCAPFSWPSSLSRLGPARCEWRCKIFHKLWRRVSPGAPFLFAREPHYTAANLLRSSDLAVCLSQTPKLFSLLLPPSTNLPRCYLAPYYFTAALNAPQLVSGKKMLKFRIVLRRIKCLEAIYEPKDYFPPRKKRYFVQLTAHACCVVELLKTCRA